jgi:signal transduction histidine kinase/ActR/RegA family two-component response regulator
MTATRILLPNRTLTRLLGTLTLRQQLGLAMAAGVLGLTLLSSVASAWQGSRQVRDTIIQQSLRVTASLANQSKLALLSGAADNASEAVAATLAFPDVLRVEIYGPAGRLLLAKGVGAASPTPTAQGWREPPPREAYLQNELDDTWRFVAPVWSTRSSTPFDVQPASDEFLGHAVVVLSKSTMRQMVGNIVLVNVLSSLFFAGLFMFVVRLLSVRLTRPLHTLSRAMERAERGEVDVRTLAEGPRDIQGMSHAFNRMIAALQERGEELQRHRGQLEVLVQERTAQLREAKERAEVASQAKSDFLTRMSHELRTPLNAIMGYAQILRMDRSLNERQFNCLGTIHGSGEHLLTLITDILDLSQIEAGKTELFPTPVDPRAMSRMLDDLIRIKAAEKQLTFLTDCSDNLPPALLMDEKRMRQVLLNLLGNAVKFTQQGLVQLHIQRLDDGLQLGMARVRFTVQDSGPGIAPQDQQRVFEPFEQAGDSRSRAAGTGLGLAISRQLVRLMGGDLHLRSEVGVGSQFWFDLSLPLGEAPLANTVHTLPRVTGYTGPRRHILIVDDVPANRHMLVDLLQPLGFDTAEAVDGQDALQQVAAHQPDLILMDLAMPVMDGLSATRHLRADLRHAKLPIIALTANASAAHHGQAMDAGASDFVSKPFDSQDLLAKVGHCLNLSWTQDHTPA